jgi:hypothetical protein
MTGPPHRKGDEERNQAYITLYAPHKHEGYSGAIIQCIGGSSVMVSVIVIVSGSYFLFL